MGKIFGVVICLVTVAAVVGCSQPKHKSRTEVAQIDRVGHQVETPAERAMKSTGLACIKEEAEQKIPAELESKAIALELKPEVQETAYIDCDNKATNVGPIVYEAQGSVLIPAPEAKEEIVEVQIESVRTCTKLDSFGLVTNLNQTGPRVLEPVFLAKGNLKIPVTTSSRQNNSELNVVEGKNLLKIKYFSCDEFEETTAPGGAPLKICAKKGLAAEQNVVLNVTSNKQKVEGTRNITRCDKQVTTGDQQ